VVPLFPPPSQQAPAQTVTFARLKNLILHNKHQSLIIFILLALIWGSSFILMKKGLASFQPVQIGALRIVLAMIFTAFFAGHHIKQLNRSNIKPLLVVGLFGNGFPYLMFPLAVSKIDSAVVGIFNAMVPLFTMLIGLFFFKTQIRLLQGIGILLGLGGAVYLLAPGSNPGLGENWMYAGLAILATIMYATSINTLKTKLAHMKSIPTTFLALVIAGIPCLIYLLTGDFFHRMQTMPHAWESLGYIALLGVFGSSVAIILFNQLVKTSTPIFSASVTYFIPVVAMAWGFLDGEQLGFTHIIGFALILTGVYLVNYRRAVK